MPTPAGHTTAIRAARVIGAEVRDTEGTPIGRIEDIVLDKMDNSIMFAVVGFGGALGLGERFHPIPWPLLDFDPAQDAFVVPYTREQLRNAPADTLNGLTRGDGQWARAKAFDYYKVTPYWN